jgi:hypothetical protein
MVSNDADHHTKLSECQVGKKEFVPYEKAREYVRSLGIKSSTEWREYCRIGNRPDNIPSDLCITYKNKGWISWGEFFGTGVVATRYIEFVSWN